jgi:hypothetical protein
LKTWLSAQPVNTAATPYTVVLTVSNLGGSSYTAGSTGNVLITNLTKYVNLDLSRSTDGIRLNAFSGCTSLAAIHVDAANTAYSSIDGILYDNDKTDLIRCPEGKTDTVTIPDSVTTIGNNAFSNCRNLASVTIPITLIHARYI